MVLGSLQRSVWRGLLLAFGAMVLLLGTGAKPWASERLDSSILSSLQWRHIGPGIISGRTVDLAVFDRDPRIVYAGTATGGVWKTDNSGVTWAPVFAETPSLGAIAVSPQNPDIVWVGSGEAWSMRANSWGDGIYKTTDGGRNWQHMGLEKTQHVGRVLIHPTDPNIVYIAALGALWTSNEERGVYKTTDGGRTWTHSLYISEYSGVADLAMDPMDPDTLYAAAFQRERRFYSFLGGGPDGGIYKTTDGGRTWERLTQGLPQGDMGRIGVAVCRSAPNVVYAAIRSNEGGFYRSEDRGETWERRNADVQTHSGYGQVRCDPNDPALVYVLDNRSHVTRDGGRTFRQDLTVGGAVHVDHHALWINPADSRHMIMGNDGGVYYTYDRGRTWRFIEEISVAQFYAIAADLREPFYRVYGGTQDNGSWGGPIGTRKVDGITNADWFVTGGGDGFYAAIDPTDPDIVYSESQYGALQRLDLKTGERRSIQPKELLDAGPYRWNWSAPFIISPHDSNTLYFAAHVLFRSSDRGDSWSVVSPDLTRALDPAKLPLQDRIQPPEAIDLGQSTARYGNISSIAESTLRRALIAVGSDDGLVHVTRDGGKTWARSERFVGVPERPYVTRVMLSRFAEETIYVTFSRHQDNDFSPYVLKSTDLGKTWTSIANNLPSGSVRVLVEHPRNPELLFVGTEMSVFASNNGGAHWVSLRNNLPIVPVHDLVVHPRENDLLIGTHGRGIWVLDDISILDELTPERLESTTHLARLRPSMQFHLVQQNRSTMGDAYFAAENPPHGAIVTYYLNPKAGVRVPTIEVLDETGSLVRWLDPPQGEKTGAIQRAVWDLRHGLPANVSTSPQPGRSRARMRGPFVLPGRYQIRLTHGSTVVTQSVAVEGDSAVSITASERRLWRDTLLSLNQMYATSETVIAAVGALQGELEGVGTALARGREKVQEIMAEVDAVRMELTEIGTAFRPPPPPSGVLRGGHEAPREAITNEITRVASQVEGWTGLPTDDQQRLIDENFRRLTSRVDALNRLIMETLPALRSRLAKHSIPLEIPVERLVVPPEAAPPFGSK